MNDIARTDAEYKARRTERPLDTSVSLRLDHVSKSYGDFTAVDDLSLDIHRGRVFGFLGPNGAGKTTTIRMIVGITAPDSGTIELFGRPFDTSMQDRIGYLPEERGLYKKLKVADQLRYFAALKNVPAAEAERRIDRWLERMNLSEWKMKKTTDLAKGMQQKIQFVSTVLHDPDLLILDEPFSGLDPVNVEFMIDVLDEFRTQEKTIIFSTHLMETAERLCSDIALINRSRKVVAGSLREIKKSFGRDLIALRGEGFGDLLEDRALVAKVTEYADEAVVELAPDADPQELLRRAVGRGARITKFERIEPRLNDNFIEMVGSTGS